MPNETIIQEIENLLSEIISLGGANEQTAIVPNVEVIDSSPVGLSNFVIVSDPRDGDNILAKKLGSIVYSNGDLVNVMFLDGGEAVAFQQGSQSATTGDIWEIVPSTTTDIFYDKGFVGINENVPLARLHIIEDADINLRIANDGSNFTEITENSVGKLSFNAFGSAGGQYSFKPGSSDTTTMFQIVDNASSVIFNIDSTNERVGIGTDSPDRNVHVEKSETAGVGVVVKVANSATATNSFASFEAQGNNGTVIAQYFADGLGGVLSGGGLVLRTSTNHAMSLATNSIEAIRITSGQRVGIGAGSPSAKLHVDQASTTLAIPVLYLDQADVSEEMIEFNTTIGTGNAIEAIGAKALTTTHFIKVTLPGALTRYFPVGTIA